MKKILACISLVFALSAGVTAFAIEAEYDSTDDNVVVTSDATYTTVMINKGDTDETPTSSNIVYVDQQTTAFGASFDFFTKSLKDSSAEGTYTVRMNKENGSEPAVTTFTVGTQVAPPSDTEVETYRYYKEMDSKLGFYEAGYTQSLVGVANPGGFNYVNINAKNTTTSQEGYLAFPLGSTVITGGTNTIVGIKLTNIPNNIEIISVTLSANKAVNAIDPN